MAQRGMKFGIFLAPFHRLGENPTLAMARDMELIEWLDWLGYDEAWVGEHHSAGFELIASPEIFLAIASQHTKHIRLGTGVISVPYHHPFMIAERIVQLDHMTRGRVMFGSGPGALQSDARMLGLEASKQRDMLDEGLGVILRLLRGETVTAVTSICTHLPCELWWNGGQGLLDCSCHPASFTPEGKSTDPTYPLPTLNQVQVRVTTAGRVEVLGTA